MTLPASSISSLGAVLSAIQNTTMSVKQQAQNALLTLQSGPVSSVWVFQFLDQMNGLIGLLNQYKSVTGLNTYATNQLPGYAGSLTTDIQAVIDAAQACINWVITNFPKDNTNTWLLAFQLNSDGSRTPRTFTTAQTAGLQTNLQAFIATIG